MGDSKKERNNIERNNMDSKASGTLDGETTDHKDDDIRIVIDDDQRETEQNRTEQNRIEQKSETHTKQQKELHRNVALEKWKIVVTKNRHRTTDDTPNE